MQQPQPDGDDVTLVLILGLVLSAGIGDNRTIA